MNLQAGVVFLLFLLSTSCATSKNENNPPQIDSPNSQVYKALAEKKFDGQANYVFNADSSAVLCVKQSKSNSAPFPVLRFFVYDVDSAEVVHEESLPRGTVEWIDKSRFRVTTVPGIVSGREDDSGSYGYVYDIKLRRKVGLPSVDQ